jgi:hypothetical protein
MLNRSVLPSGPASTRSHRQRTFCLTPFQRKLNGGLQQNGLRHDVIDQTGFQRLTGAQLFTG